jgi:hypothetical protein
MRICYKDVDNIKKTQLFDLKIRIFGLFMAFLHVQQLQQLEESTNCPENVHAPSLTCPPDALKFLIHLSVISWFGSYSSSKSQLANHYRKAWHGMALKLQAMIQTKWNCSSTRITWYRRWINNFYGIWCSPATARVVEHAKMP